MQRLNICFVPSWDLGTLSILLIKHLAVRGKRHFCPSSEYSWNPQKSLVLPYTPSLENIGKHIKYNGEKVDVAFKFSNTIKKRLTQNSNKDVSSEKGVYILPCLDCNNK